MIESRSHYHFGYFAPHGVSPKPDIIAKLLADYDETIALAPQDTERIERRENNGNEKSE